MSINQRIQWFQPLEQSFVFHFPLHANWQIYFFVGYKLDINSEYSLYNIYRSILLATKFNQSCPDTSTLVRTDNNIRTHRNTCSSTGSKLKIYIVSWKEYFSRPNGCCRTNGTQPESTIKQYSIPFVGYNCRNGNL